ncbi:ribonuclease M5 [Fructobacillus sp. M2-14]|uniref:Ribonuclease M5 n=1 Tax=Fructobacillus broussonetiae TaxID=2713173 RepID=A0ABS5R0E5_9LACO|nr:ribonuclease M5 [Fructobacillus broussonetiae]MBS9338831.1 ribonuclease M5 [Fructobacillus broussonetiae]
MTKGSGAQSSASALPVIKAAVVVEGWSDTQRLALAVSCDTIETRGSALEKPVLDQIKRAQEERGVIVLTDPDFNGNRLRNLILKAVPEVTLASISKDEGRADRDNPHKSLGIEHASVETLRAVLLDADEQAGKVRPVSDIDRDFLFELGLLGSGDAKKKRERIGNALSFGYANGKQLLSRLTALGYQKEDVLNALKGGQHGQNN